MRLLGVVVELMKRSWTCLNRQKVEESSKCPKNFKSLKSRKSHRFGGTFTEAPILRQLDKKNLSSFAEPRSSFDTHSEQLPIMQSKWSC